MKSIDRPSNLYIYQTIVGIIGFLIVVIGSTVTSNLYGEIDDVEAVVMKHGTKVDSQEHKINEINLTTQEILLKMGWQGDNIDKIVTQLDKLEAK